MTSIEALKDIAGLIGIQVELYTGEGPFNGELRRKVEPEPPEPCSKWVVWNPCNNDADAFRLQNALRLNIFHANGNAYAMLSDCDGEIESCVSYRDAGGIDRATRRAVLKVAEILAKEESEE